MKNQYMTTHSDTPTRSQSGFSLVELMVAITISLLILIAMVGVYVNLSRSNNEMAKTNIQIENGRLAMQLLQTEIAHAGFWGGYVPQFDDMSSVAAPVSATAGGSVPSAVPDPCREYTVAGVDNWTPEYKANLLGIPIHGYNAVPAGCSAVVTNRKAGTDVLVMRHVETCKVAPSPAVSGERYCEEADTPGKLYFQASLCATDTQPFQLNTTGHTLRKKDCTTLADKRKFISSIYYIRDYAVTPGDGIPTLVRSRFDLVGSPAELKHPEDATALVEGIEDFRVEFGIDTVSDEGVNILTDAALAKRYDAAIMWKDATNLVSPINRGDGVPDGAFVRCATSDPTTDPCADHKLMANVVAAKVFILARSRETSPGHTDTKKYKLGSAAEVGPFNDGYKRHVFSATVRLANVSGRRETPL